MFEAMAELEALCAGLAAERMMAAERSALEAMHEKLRTLIHVGDPQSYHEVNEAFHDAIYAGAHNGYLAEMTLATRVACSRSAAPSSAISAASRNRTPSTTGSWSAILRGDRAGAAAAMRAHIRRCARNTRSSGVGVEALHAVACGQLVASASLASASIAAFSAM